MATEVMAGRYILVRNQFGMHWFMRDNHWFWLGRHIGLTKVGPAVIVTSDGRTILSSPQGRIG